MIDAATIRRASYGLGITGIALGIITSIRNVLLGGSVLEMYDSIDYALTTVSLVFLVLLTIGLAWWVFIGSDSP